MAGARSSDPAKVRAAAYRQIDALALHYVRRVAQAASPFLRAKYYETVRQMYDHYKKAVPATNLTEAHFIARFNRGLK